MDLPGKPTRHIIVLYCTTWSLLQTEAIAWTLFVEIWSPFLYFSQQNLLCPLQSFYFLLCFQNSNGFHHANDLSGPALLHLPIIADQSQASWPLCSPPPSPSVSMFLASLHWFSSVMGAVVVTGWPWILPWWVTTAFGGPSITTHLPPGSSADEF